MLCCLIGLATLSPVGAWIVARRQAVAGEAGYQQDRLISAGFVVAGVSAACVAGYLLMAASSETGLPDILYQRN